MTDEQKAIMHEMAWGPCSRIDIPRNQAVLAALIEIDRLKAELAKVKAGPAAIVRRPRYVWDLFDYEPDAWEFLASRYDCENPIRVEEWNWHSRKEDGRGTADDQAGG